MTLRALAQKAPLRGHPPSWRAQMARASLRSARPVVRAPWRGSRGSCTMWAPCGGSALFRSVIILGCSRLGALPQTPHRPAGALSVSFTMRRVRGASSAAQPPEPPGRPPFIMLPAGGSHTARSCGSALRPPV